MENIDITGNITQPDARLVYVPENKKCILAELGELTWMDQPDFNVASLGLAKADFAIFEGSEEEWNLLDNLL